MQRSVNQEQDGYNVQKRDYVNVGADGTHDTHLFVHTHTHTMHSLFIKKIPRTFPTEAEALENQLELIKYHAWARESTSGRHANDLHDVGIEDSHAGRTTKPIVQSHRQGNEAHLVFGDDFCEVGVTDVAHNRRRNCRISARTHQHLNHGDVAVEG